MNTGRTGEPETGELFPEPFTQHFSRHALGELYEARVKGRVKTMGIDRIGAASFERNRDFHLDVIARKISNGSYAFTPYKEVLISKGRGKAPRIISISTIRDKVTLAALKKALFELFPESVNYKIPNAYIRELKHRPSVFNAFYRFDFQDFYPSIKHAILLKKVLAGSKRTSIAELVKKAISNPTIPSSFRSIKGEPSIEGVPQGLPISNILAEIYLRDFDKYLQKKGIYFHRYVDDVIVFCDASTLESLKKSVLQKSRQLGLTIHPGKSFGSETGNDPFTFLGYRFEGVRATISQPAIDKFRMSLIKLFSRRKYGEIPPERFRYLLNLRITGAIKNNRRIGWMAFYVLTDDKTAIFELDSFIEKLFQRFGFSPVGIKRISKVLRILHFRKGSGYIPDFDSYTTADKRNDLIEIGIPASGWNDEHVEREFDRLTDKELASIEKDIHDVS